MMCARVVPRIFNQLPWIQRTVSCAIESNARCFSSIPSFKASDLHIEFCAPNQLKPKPPVEQLQFGATFTDHMLEIQWSDEGGWETPKISPFHNLSIHPAAKSLHYAIELFEGMKAYRGSDDQIRMFRPDQNMIRMNRSAARASLPTFDGGELTEIIRRLIAIDQEWVPHAESSSLYIRPTIIANEETLKVEQPSKALLFVILSPTGPYFTSGFKPVSLLADPNYVRAWPGGCGDTKMGSNYAPTIHFQKLAMQQGLQQVLWLFGPDHTLTEVGAMNIMVLLDKGNGEKELVTPPLNGLILPGVTRSSLLELARSWNEFTVSEREINMKEIIQAEADGKLLEVFGCGTAVVVCPVKEIHYQNQVIKIPTMDYTDNPVNQRLYNQLLDIQFGKVKHPWGVPIEGK